MPLFVHAGMPKCGSSGIQGHLSSSEFRKKSSAQIEYLAITKTADIVCGKYLVEQAQKTPFRYISSVNQNVIEGFSDSQCKKIADEINTYLKEKKTVILSSEGWGPRPSSTSDIDRIFTRLMEPANLVFYVRPQVEWFNSAWWQWGAWTDRPLSTWVAQNEVRAEWGRVIAKWEEKDWVKKVIPRLMGSDVVSDFLKVVGFPEESNHKSNISMPGSMLRFMQIHRDLRPDPHSPQIEFILSRYIDLPTEETPWVLPITMVRKLLLRYRDDNLLLSQYLDEEQNERFFSDMRWWAEAQYLEKKRESPEPQKPSYEELEELLLRSIEGLKRVAYGK